MIRIALALALLASPATAQELPEGEFECHGFLGFYMRCKLPAPPKTTTIVCPPEVKVSKQTIQAAGAELEKLPRGHPLRVTNTAFVKQRQLTRECLEQKRRRG